MPIPSVPATFAVVNGGPNFVTFAIPAGSYGWGVWSKTSDLDHTCKVGNDGGPTTFPNGTTAVVAATAAQMSVIDAVAGQLLQVYYSDDLVGTENVTALTLTLTSSGGNGIPPGAQSIVVLPRRQDRHTRMVVNLTGDQAFQALLKISDDDGVTWYTVQQVDSSVVVADAGSGTVVDGAKVNIDLPIYWRLDVNNTGSASLNLRIDTPIYDDKFLNG